MADVTAISSREYKVMLDHRRFADRKPAAANFWREVARCANRLMGAEASGEFERTRKRSIVFLDTPDETVRLSGFVLRQRTHLERTRTKYTLKCRSTDRYMAGGAYVEATAKDAEPKFEEDIGAPFAPRYSLSNTSPGAPAERKICLGFSKQLGVPTKEPARLLSASNVVTSLRLVGSPAIVLFAMNDKPLGAGIVVAALVFSEWLDGFLARALHQESDFGARLDTVADAAFYLSLLVALLVLSPDSIKREAAWIAGAIGTYAGSWLAALVKFRSLPSYHTWIAKGAWLLVGVGTASLVANWYAWPFRIAMLCVVMANIEAMMITFVLHAPSVNVPSIWHARRVGSDS